jgi:hypothetical protein
MLKNLSAVREHLPPTWLDAPGLDEHEEHWGRGRPSNARILHAPWLARPGQQSARLTHRRRWPAYCAQALHSERARRAACFRQAHSRHTRAVSRVTAGDKRPNSARIQGSVQGSDAPAQQRPKSGAVAPRRQAATAAPGRRPRDRAGSRPASDQMGGRTGRRRRVVQAKNGAKTQGHTHAGGRAIAAPATGPP